MSARGPESEKIFCISFHKTGTTSFHNFLESFGIASCHGAKKLDGKNFRPDLEQAKHDLDRVTDVLAPFLDRYQALSDTPYNVIYRQLASKYPTARFVLVTRNLDSWWNSLHEHWGLHLLGHRLTTLEYIQYSPYLSDCDRIFTRGDRDQLIAAHRAHMERVTAHLKDRSFISVELEDPDKAGKLARFLGLEHVAAFPHSKAKGAGHSLKRVLKNVRMRMRSAKLGS